MEIFVALITCLGFNMHAVNCCIYGAGYAWRVVLILSASAAIQRHVCEIREARIFVIPHNKSYL